MPKTKTAADIIRMYVDYDAAKKGEGIYLCRPHRETFALRHPGSLGHGEQGDTCQWCEWLAEV